MLILKVIFIALIFFSCGQAQIVEDQNNVEENMNSDIEVENSVEISKESEDTESKSLLISDNFKLFYEGLEVSEGPDFNVQIVSDIDILNDNLYFVTGLYEGIVYKYNPNNQDRELFVDLSEKLIFTEDKNNEMGLLSFELHPSLEYFLVAYVNKSMKLIVEQHFIDSQTLNLIESDPVEILSVQYFDKVHFSANLIYSDYFDGFIFSAGDGLGDQLGLRGDSIFTYINRGKILLLLSNKNNNIKNPTISYGITENENIILAYGVRNPWGMAVLQNRLYIPDVGRSTYEEVSILDLAVKESEFLGYPMFEGPVRTDYSPKEIYSWNEGQKQSADNFLSEKYQPPAIFYKHIDSKYGYRCAVIGGAVVQDIDHNTWNDTFNFIDYCTKELFTYSYTKNTLIASPIPLNVDNLYISKLVYLDNLSFLLLGFTYEVRDGEYFVKNKNFIVELPNLPVYLED